MNNEEKKKFWKLPSHLRMEYIKHEEKIEASFRSNNTLSFIWTFFIILFGTFTMSALYYLTFDNLILFTVVLRLKYLFYFGFFVCLGVDIAQLILRNQKLNKLKALFLNGRYKL